MCQSQETKDVKERFEDLATWVTALEESLTKSKTSNDPEEGERRQRLAQFVSRLLHLTAKLTRCRSLTGIKKSSEELSGKGKMARVLDKAQDSKKATKLVEDLRQAILIYQVGSSGKNRDRLELTRSG